MPREKYSGGSRCTLPGPTNKRGTRESDARGRCVELRPTRVRARWWWWELSQGACIRDRVSSGIMELERCPWSTHPLTVQGERVRGERRRQRSVQRSASIADLADPPTSQGLDSGKLQSPQYMGTPTCARSLAFSAPVPTATAHCHRRQGSLGCVASSSSRVRTVLEN